MSIIENTKLFSIAWNKAKLRTVITPPVSSSFQEITWPKHIPTGKKEIIFFLSKN